MACLDEPTVVAFVAGQLDAPAIETIDDHLADCPSCRDLVVWAAKTSLAIGSSRNAPAAAAPGDAPASPADAPARYAITALVGVGGQGLVYAATDAVLSRRVALKVLRRRDDEILREARLVARLNHPNIVAVYDAGTTSEGVIYLAMEYVADTLATWRAGRSPGEILRACIDAGRGLVAAHDAGIIHRDIKPSNILIADGRARLTDFGLALEADQRRESPATGLAGTLAYMAPEQLAGEATRASDQFSLAAAIWESLTGALPFPGLDRRPPPPAASLPRHVDLALRRALAREPRDRYPDVAGLLAALAFDPVARRRRRLAAGGGLAMLGATAIAIGLAAKSRSPACALGDSLDGVWDETARTLVTRGLSSRSEPYAGAAALAVRDALDRYARDWIAHRTRACELHESPEVYALRTQCLDERKGALAAVVRTLRAPDRDILDHALELAQGLPALAPCDDTAWLGQRVRPPTELATLAKVSAIDAALAESATAMRAGKIERSIRLAEQAVRDSATIDHAPTRARAALALGEARAHRPDNRGAEESLTSATQWAQHARDDRVAAQAFIALVKVVGYGLGRFDEALREAAFADATLARLGGDPDLHATLELHRCAVYAELARFAEAEASCSAALADRTAAQGPDALSTADVLVLQARILTSQARYPQAIEVGSRALGIRERALGPDHPALVEALYALGHTEVRSGALAAAERHFDRAGKVALATFGEDSSVMASLWAERSAIAARRGDLATALADIDRSTAIRERIGGPMHVDLVFDLITRGRILDDQRDFPAAAASLARALEIAERSYGKDHPNVMAILQDLGRLHAKLGDPQRARAELDRAIAIATATGNRKAAAGGEAALAEMLHAAGRPREAVPRYERALAGYEALLGERSPQLVPTLENLALAHLDLHEPALALPLLDRAIVLERETTGERSANLITPLDSRGDAELALGDRAKAKATWKAALALDDVAARFPEDYQAVKRKLERL